MSNEGFLSLETKNMHAHSRDKEIRGRVHEWGALACEGRPKAICNHTMRVATKWTDKIVGKQSKEVGVINH